MKGSYHLYLDWEKDGLSPAEIGVRTLETLDALASIPPTRPDWRLVDFSNPTPMPDDADFDEDAPDEEDEGATVEQFQADPAKFVEGNVVRDDWRSPAPDEGYRISAYDDRAGRENRPLQVMELRIRAGSNWTNSVTFGIGRYGYQKETDASYLIYRRALERLADIWSSAWGKVYYCVPDRRRLRPATAANLDAVMAEADAAANEPNPHLPWIAYLSAERASGLTAPNLLIADPTPGGGMILSVTRDRFDAANPDHRQRAVILKSVLRHCVDDPVNIHRAPAPRVGPF